MKKLLSITLFIICFISIAKAQKGKLPTGVIITNPERKVVVSLPDLNILLIPKLTNGGVDAIYEPVAGVPGRIKIPVDMIIKNIGFATSTTCKVVLYARFQRTRSFSEVEHGVAEGAFNDLVISEPITLLALEQKKDVLRTHSFVFNRFPTLAPGKKVRLVAEIIYPTINGEITTTNNVSRTFEVNLVTAF